MVLEKSDRLPGTDGMLNISLVDVDPEVLVDLRASELDGKQAEDRLHRRGDHGHQRCLLRGLPDNRVPISAAVVGRLPRSQRS
jgi:hypothetical protein